MTHDLSRLGLGSVQWGLRYGISNESGQTSSEEVKQILRRASTLGVKYIDTATMYGESEKVLGQNDLQTFSVVTKSPRIQEIKSQAAADEAVKRGIEHSLSLLKCESVYGYLIHNVDDLMVASGKFLANALEKVRTKGKVKKVGVSVYNSDQVDAVINLFTPDIIQLPINVFDQRMIHDGTLKKLKNLGVEIHARSSFLQGLLLMEPGRAPKYFEPIQNLLQSWHSQVANQKSTPLQAALSFVRGIREIDAVIVGIESVRQLDEVAKAFQSDQTFVPENLACSDVRFINPAQWKVT